MREHDSTLWNGKFCPTVISEDTHIVNMERRKAQKSQNDWQSPVLTEIPLIVEPGVFCGCKWLLVLHDASLVAATSLDVVMCTY